MLPVQTVMIRYMVLVYRWGRGWLGAVGCGGFVGGCSGRVEALAGEALAAGAVATRTGHEKAPLTVGPAGPFAN